MKKVSLLFAFSILAAASSYAQTATNKIDSVGDVGIGTISPITKLEVKGTVFSSNLANDAGVYMSGEDGGYGLLQATNNYNSVAKDLILQKYGGNVGVGTTFAPLALTVGTQYTNDGLRVGGSTYHLDIMSNMGANAYHPLVKQNDIGIIFKGASNGYAGGLVLAPWTNAVGGLRMDNTGRIGIGTDPVAMMTFRAPQNVTSNLEDPANYALYIRPDYNGSDAAAQGIAFGGNNSQGNHISAAIYHAQLGAPSYGDLVFATTSNGGSLAERLRINSTGNVGIGTNQPNNKLTVLGNADFSGSVGIGISHISDTSYKLYVENGIRTRKVKVDQTAWSDYVFAPAYSLPSLREVEAFIKQHKHLPDVPSANEVGEKGLDLGENQALLLKKIEELTLYVIELKKQADVQQKEITDLKNELGRK